MSQSRKIWTRRPSRSSSNFSASKTRSLMVGPPVSSPSGPECHPQQGDALGVLSCLYSGSAHSVPPSQKALLPQWASPGPSAATRFREVVKQRKKAMATDSSTLAHLDVQLFQHHLLPGLSLPHRTVFTPLSKITSLYLYRSISGLSSLFHCCICLFRPQ